MRALFLYLAMITIFSSVAMGDNGGTQPYSRNVEIRAVWMDRRSIPKTETEIRVLVRKYSNAGINLIYPEVIYNGYSAYPSDYLTSQNLWNGLDVLSILIDEAHKRHIEIHPWVWVFRTGNINDKGGILAKHPDWVAINKNGQDVTPNGSYWLCPSIPGVRRLLLNAYSELAAKYKIDGIHLDYIRFEDQSPVPYCYNDSCRQQFQLQYGLDPLNIEPFTSPVIDWHMWREDLVNTFVSEVSAKVRKVRPAIKVSAAVGSPYDTARVNLLQNWAHWADNKWVDFLAPMDYTSNPDNFLRRVDASAKTVSNKALLAPGIGLHVLKGIPPVLEQIQIAQREPAAGITLFASSYMSDDLLTILGEGVFRKRADLPVNKPAEGAKKLLSSAISRIDKQASVNDMLNAGLDVQSAKALIDYDVYRKSAVGYIKPSPPPIFIPDKVQPLPEISVPVISSAPVIDGKLDDSVWQQASSALIQVTNLGHDVTRTTDVKIIRDNLNLYIGFRASEPRTGSVKATVTERDGPVFQDDSIELFLDPQGTGAVYYHFAMNTLGTRFDQKVSDTAWNGDWQGAVSVGSDSWAAEISIPFSILGAVPPSAGDVWHANFCRNRYADGTVENSCWSATYGTYHTPVRFGRIVY
ncbi:MAG: family 10 glycosylhydrolase [Armatimonadota bacterium]